MFPPSKLKAKSFEDPYSTIGTADFKCLYGPSPRRIESNEHRPSTFIDKSVPESPTEIISFISNPLFRPISPPLVPYCVLEPRRGPLTRNHHPIQTICGPIVNFQHTSDCTHKNIHSRRDYRDINTPALYSATTSLAPP